MSKYELCRIPFSEAQEGANKARFEGVYTLIGGLIRRDDGALFSQRRSLTRRFGPGLWDNVGGHVEGDESLYETLAREIREETGWTLKTVHDVVAIRDWADDRGTSQEFIVLCTVDGDLDHPNLETEKVDRFMWVCLDNVEQLNENRRDDLSQVDIYRHALSFSL